MRQLSAAVFLFACISMQPLFAQMGGFAGTNSRIGFGPRGLGVSNAMSALTSEGSYSYYNPAHAATYTSYRQVDLSVASLQFDRVLQSTGVTFQLPPKAGLALSIQRTGITDIDGRTVSGYSTGSFDTNEYLINGAFGIRLSDRFQAGLGVKLSVANYHQELDPATSVGIDLGSLYKISDHVNFAFVIQDLIANYTWNSADLYATDRARNVINNFPTRFKWGLAYEQEAFSITSEFEVLSFSSEIRTTEQFIDNGIPVTINSVEDVNTSASSFRLGGVWNAHERFTLRGGYQLPELTDTESWGLSSGFSIHLPFDTFSPSIDYAFVLEPYQISTMHVFALNLKL
ncbi:MAG: hypothetical protein AAFW89_12800 [Bacteroidota bacterium]